MRSDSPKATCLICYQQIEINLHKDELFTCYGCGQTFHYNHLKSWVVEHKSCPNCREDLRALFVNFNASGIYMPCQDGFHLSAINKNRKTCVRCLQSLNSQFGIRSQLSRDNKNNLEYRPVTENYHSLGHQNAWRRLQDLFKELDLLRTLFVLVFMVLTISLFILIFLLNTEQIRYLNLIISGLAGLFVLFIFLLGFLNETGIIEFDTVKPNKKFKSPYEL